MKSGPIGAKSEASKNFINKNMNNDDLLSSPIMSDSDEHTLRGHNGQKLLFPDEIIVPPIPILTPDLNKRDVALMKNANDLDKQEVVNEEKKDDDEGLNKSAEEKDDRESLKNFGKGEDDSGHDDFNAAFVRSFKNLNNGERDH